MISVKDIVLDIHFYATLKHALSYSMDIVVNTTDSLAGPIRFLRTEIRIMQQTYLSDPTELSQIRQLLP